MSTAIWSFKISASTLWTTNTPSLTLARYPSSSLSAEVTGHKFKSLTLWGVHCSLPIQWSTFKQRAGKTTCSHWCTFCLSCTRGHFLALSAKTARIAMMLSLATLWRIAMKIGNKMKVKPRICFLWAWDPPTATSTHWNSKTSPTTT